MGKTKDNAKQRPLGGHQILAIMRSGADPSAIATTLLAQAGRQVIPDRQYRRTVAKAGTTMRRMAARARYVSERTGNTIEVHPDDLPQYVRRSGRFTVFETDETDPLAGQSMISALGRKKVDDATERASNPVYQSILSEEREYDDFLSKEEASKQKQAADRAKTKRRNEIEKAIGWPDDIQPEDVPSGQIYFGGPVGRDQVVATVGQIAQDAVEGKIHPYIAVSHLVGVAMELNQKKKGAKVRHFHNVEPNTMHGAIGRIVRDLLIGDKPLTEAVDQIMEGIDELATGTPDEEAGGKSKGKGAKGKSVSKSRMVDQEAIDKITTDLAAGVITREQATEALFALTDKAGTRKKQRESAAQRYRSAVDQIGVSPPEVAIQMIRDIDSMTGAEARAAMAEVGLDTAPGGIPVDQKEALKRYLSRRAQPGVQQMLAAEIAKNAKPPKPIRTVPEAKKLVERVRTLPPAEARAELAVIEKAPVPVIQAVAEGLGADIGSGDGKKATRPLLLQAITRTLVAAAKGSPGGAPSPAGRPNLGPGPGPQPKMQSPPPPGPVPNVDYLSPELPAIAPAPMPVDLMAPPPPRSPGHRAELIDDLPAAPKAPSPAGPGLGPMPSPAYSQPFTADRADRLADRDWHSDQSWMDSADSIAAMGDVQMAHAIASGVVHGAWPGVIGLTLSRMAPHQRLQATVAASLDDAEQEILTIRQRSTFSLGGQKADQRPLLALRLIREAGVRPGRVPASEIEAAVRDLAVTRQRLTQSGTPEEHPQIVALQAAQAAGQVALDIARGGIGHPDTAISAVGLGDRLRHLRGQHPDISMAAKETAAKVLRYAFRSQPEATHEIRMSLWSRITRRRGNVQHAVEATWYPLRRMGFKVGKRWFGDRAKAEAYATASGGEVRDVSRQGQGKKRFSEKVAAKVGKPAEGPAKKPQPPVTKPEPSDDLGDTIDGVLDAGIENLLMGGDAFDFAERVRENQRYEERKKHRMGFKVGDRWFADQAAASEFAQQSGGEVVDVTRKPDEDEWLEMVPPEFEEAGEEDEWPTDNSARSRNFRKLYYHYRGTGLHDHVEAKGLADAHAEKYEIMRAARLLARDGGSVKQIREAGQSLYQNLHLDDLIDLSAKLGLPAKRTEKDSQIVSRIVRHLVKRSKSKRAGKGSQKSPTRQMGFRVEGTKRWFPNREQAEKYRTKYGIEGQVRDVTRKPGGGGSKKATATKAATTKTKAKAKAKEDSEPGDWGTEKQPYYRPGPNPTVDTVITRDGKNGKKQILLIKRKGKWENGKWALPGGFHDTDAPKGQRWKPGRESVEDAAIRELAEETGLDVKTIKANMAKVGVFGDKKKPSGRDPRDNPKAWAVSTAFQLHIPSTTAANLDDVRGSDDASDAQWIDVDKLGDMELAFDHKNIVEKAGIVIGEEKGKGKPTKAPEKAPANIDRIRKLANRDRFTFDEAYAVGNDITALSDNELNGLLDELGIDFVGGEVRNRRQAKLIMHLLTKAYDPRKSRTGEKQPSGNRPATQEEYDRDETLKAEAKAGPGLPTELEFSGAVFDAVGGDYSRSDKYRNLAHAWRQFDKLSEEEQRREYRTAYAKGGKFGQSEIGARVLFAGFQGGLNDNQMLRLIKAIEDRMNRRRGRGW